MTHGRIEKSKSITKSMVVGSKIFVTTERKALPKHLRILGELKGNY